MSSTEHSEQAQPLGLAVDRGVGRLVPERAAFEAWLNPGGHAGNVSAWVEPGRYENDTHQLAWLAWLHWERAVRQTWRMVDPLYPAGQPGSYARGSHNGIVDALTTLRANLKTPNVGGEARLAAHQPSQTTTATPQGVASTDQLGGPARSEKE